MKVLLIGEYSNVHNNLKYGLESFGVDVKTANLGDYFKKFHSDIKLHRINKNARYDFLRNMYSNYLYKKFVQYDVIQFMNEAEIGIEEGFHRNLARKLVHDAKLSVLLIAGCNVQYAGLARQKLKITPCTGCLKYDVGNIHGCPYRNNRNIVRVSYFIQKNVDVMVPMSYEYYVCSKEGKFAEKMTEPIPMPIVVDKEPVKASGRRSGRLVVFHPLNREGFKGTREIRKAFRILEQKYSGIAEFIIDGKMSYDEYMKLVARADIIVDQRNGYSFGMGSLDAMYYGKVLLTGNYRHEIDDPYFNYLREAPAFELGITVNDIVKNISRVIEQRDNFADIGKRGTEFVREHFDAKEIAEQFLHLYESGLKKKQEHFGGIK